MTYFKFILILIFNFVLLHATMYEDAENATTSKWKRVNSDTFSSINNIRDKSKKSRVIEFNGTGTKQIYELETSDLKSTKDNEYWLSWEMKFSEDFVIILVLQTNRGKHYLIYTPGRFKSHMQYGLGPETTNGKWKTFRRNIQKDIAYFDNRVKVISLKSFVLKGNGMIDNIRTVLVPKSKTLKSNPLQNKILNKKLIPEKKLILDKKQKEVFKGDTNSAPIINMKGMKLVKLNLGEIYVEEGVSAYDKEDGEINVVTMENIYSNEVGRYIVLYMATDSDGNIAIDKRYVDVGDVESKKKKDCFDETKDKKASLDKTEEEEIDEGDSDEDEQATQMRLWEKTLALREKELRKKFELREKELGKKRE